jgi:hypothetical protein
MTLPPATLKTRASRRSPTRQRPRLRTALLVPLPDRSATLAPSLRASTSVPKSP